MKTKSFKIDPKILKHLREKLKLPQKTLALRALSDGTNTKPESLLRNYQHIERTGKTSPDRAKKIASALGVTIRQLQESSLDDMTSNLKEVLRHRIEELKEAEDDVGLKRIAKLLCLEKEDIDKAQSNEDKRNNHLTSGDNLDVYYPSGRDYSSIAKLVFEQAEYFRLVGETQELQNLAEALGVSVERLRPPTSVNQYWWIWSGNHRNDNPYFGKLIHNGTTGIIEEIREHLESILDSFYSHYEIKLTLTKQNERYLLRFELSESDHKWSLAFCACDVSGSHGIEWVNTTGWEHECLLGPWYLRGLFFDYADQVVIEGEQFPPAGKELVYRVRFFTASYSEYDESKFFPAWEEYGSRIFNDTWQFRTSLQELLKEHEEEKWLFKDSLEPMGVGESCLKGIEIRLCENNPKRRTEKFEVKRYQISFGWLNDEGEFFSAPWPAIRRKQFIEWFRQLKGAPIFVPDDDFVIPRFEPSDIQNISEE